MTMKQTITIKHQAFSWKARFKSFLYAWNGIKALLKTEHNAWIHLGATIAVIFFSIEFNISSTEAIALIIVTALVWMAELFNTAIEKSIDFVSTEIHPQIRIIKDLSAAAVLTTSVAAALVGLIIFVPKIIVYVQTF
jgi:diacylglycerol kinase (ATP)